ncbi:MAG: glycosyltransferase family 2 protein [Pseudomonadota bacterium]
MPQDAIESGKSNDNVPATPILEYEVDLSYVQNVQAEAAKCELDVRLPAQRQRNRFSPVLISVIKNERHRLERFVTHHRDRGVQEFVFIDNGSTDDSLSWLRAQPDVLALTVDRPFDWQAKQGWITHVINKIGRQRWFLVLDADERLVYPGEDQHDLSDLAAQMELEEIWRVRGMLIDLYGPGSLLASGTGEHRLFDGEGYATRETYCMNSVMGGPRARALATPDFALQPELTKYPLFRIGEEDLMANPHHLWPFGANYKSPCHLGLLHDKFGKDLLDKIERAIRENSYWNGSFEYRAYRAALQANPQLSLVYDGTRCYERPDDLVDAGLLAPIDWASKRRPRWLLQARARWSPLAVFQNRRQD